LDDVNAGKAAPEQGAESPIILDQKQPLRRNTALQQRLRDRACAWSKLDNWPGFARIDIACHHPRQKRSRWGDRAANPGVVEPRLEKARVVGEPKFDWGRRFSRAARVGQRGWARQERCPSLKIRRTHLRRARRQ